MPSLRNRFDTLLERRTGAIPKVRLSPPQRLALVRRHGDFSLAYSTAVQEGLRYHGDGEGYIAFGEKMGTAFALGDPVAAPGRRAAYIERFVGDAKNPCFVQVGRQSAVTLAGLGYKVNRMGVDSVLDLAAHDFSGKRNETVRYSERWLLKNGYSLVEQGGDAVLAGQVERLSADWRAERIVSHKEMQFLNRPFSAKPGEGMRRFVLSDPGGRLIALLDFDPIFSDGAVCGYTTAFKRKLGGITAHAEVGLTKFAVDRFRAEGLRTVTLGLSPLAGMDTDEFPENALMRRLFGAAYGSKSINRRIFNLQGQAAFKRRFHGAEEPTYIAFRKGTLFEMMGLLRLCKAL